MEQQAAAGHPWLSGCETRYELDRKTSGTRTGISPFPRTSSCTSGPCSPMGFSWLTPSLFRFQLLTKWSKMDQKNSDRDRCQRHLHDGPQVTLRCTGVLQDADPVDRVGKALRDRAAVKPGRDLASLLPLLYGSGQYPFRTSKQLLHLDGDIGVTQSKLQSCVGHQTTGRARSRRLRHVSHDARNSLDRGVGLAQQALDPLQALLAVALGSLRDT